MLKFLSRISLNGRRGLILFLFCLPTFSVYGKSVGVCELATNDQLSPLILNLIGTSLKTELRSKGASMVEISADPSRCLDGGSALNIGKSNSVNYVIGASVSKSGRGFEVFPLIVDVNSGNTIIDKSIKADDIVELESNIKSFVEFFIENYYKKDDTTETATSSGSGNVTWYSESERNHWSYVLRSAVIPGWGQFTAEDSERGALFLGSNVALFTIYASFYGRYNSIRNNYNQNYISYVIITQSTKTDQALDMLVTSVYSEQQKDLDRAARNSNIALALFLGMYGWNLIDALQIEKPWEKLEKQAGNLKLDLFPVLSYSGVNFGDSGLGFRFSLNF